MNTFHLILQRSIVCFFVLCFAFVSVYIPQSWNDVKMAEAGGVLPGPQNNNCGLSGTEPCASETSSAATTIETGFTNVSTTA